VVWDQAQVNKTCNFDCDLAAVDEFQFVSGAWSYAMDYNIKCTSMANDVISTYINNMSAFGELTVSGIT